MKVVLALFGFLAITQSMDAVAIDTIPIGNIANSPDQNHRGDGRFGRVEYFYRIGVTEVTNDQYAEFLNAVAAIDTHGLYSGGYGIHRFGLPGAYSYTVEPNLGNKPVIQVSFWDAARFANWLHNGRPVGNQTNSTTEDGAYTLGDVTNPPIASVNRNDGATWFLPSENEWYKAAYHQPATRGGDVDDYWLYPTATNSQPTIARANSVGDIRNPGPNVANHWGGAGWGTGATGYLTSVGSAGPLSASYYGTFDQAGNVLEWLEDIHNFSPNTRVVRGGDWRQDYEPLAAWFRNGIPPVEERDHVGFRVATIVPEPASIMILVLASFATTDFRIRRSRLLRIVRQK
jgi:formylglycine-generating enzyme required for sulfatase activity